MIEFIPQVDHSVSFVLVYAYDVTLHLAEQHWKLLKTKHKRRKLISSYKQVINSYN